MKKIISVFLAIVVLFSFGGIESARAYSLPGTSRVHYDTWTLHYNSNVPASANATTKQCRLAYYSLGYVAKCDRLTSPSYNVKLMLTGTNSTFIKSVGGDSTQHSLEITQASSLYTDVIKFNEPAGAYVYLNVEAVNYGTSLSSEGYVIQKDLQ